MEQARRDCGMRSAGCGVPKIPIVAHRRSFCSWLVTMEAETFFKFLCGTFLELVLRKSPCDPSRCEDGEMEFQI
jgi:hypothetical protein